MIKFIKNLSFRKLPYLSSKAIKGYSKILTYNQISDLSRYSQTKQSISYSYTSQKISNVPPQQNQIQSNIIKIQNIQEHLKKDIFTTYKFNQYQNIKNQFIEYIQKQDLSLINSQKLLKVCHLISYYPKFTLPNNVILKIYKIICHNMHLKNVQLMNQMLLFSLVADKNVSQSPIFHEFVKFYVGVTFEEFKFKYKIDFENLSLYQGIKQFVGRLVQKGFSSRSPQYYRNLNVIQYERTCELLLNNNQTKDSLMIKKINFTKFINIKAFYEQQMKENLYHMKKVALMKKFDHYYMKTICRDAPMIKNQVVYLRQLYMKLYLSLPYEETSQICQQDLLSLKYKNIIYLYQLSVEYINNIKQKDGLQPNQSIILIRQFVNQVEDNFKLFDNHQFTLCLELQEKLLILQYLMQFQNESRGYEIFMNNVIKQFNPFYFEHYFDLFLVLFKRFKNIRKIVPFIQRYEVFDILQMSKIQQLIKFLGQYIIINNQNRQTALLFLDNIMRKLISTDFTVIAGSQIINFLKILSILQKAYIHDQYIGDKWKNLHQNGYDLRIFCLRYIADHHSEFSLRQFQEILNCLLNNSSLKEQKFNDQENNYGKYIFQQIHPYIQKVNVFLSLEVKQRLNLSKKT